ncbi:FAD-binding protein [Clostridium cagae]|uniref:FAD-dependent oxidoreductase n=1 Tax=Clostridium cagae TaxID=2080751 RepID=UPI003F75992D
MIEIITPSDKNYSESRKEWNRAIEKYPKAIAYCKTYDDIKKALYIAKKNNLNIRLRSGGHNYQGFSIANNAFVIDISNLNKIEINYKLNTVTVEGGANNNQLYNFISSKGYPFPGGTCPTVGLTGFTSGGGIGFSTRYLGLGCDSLIELKLINYRGCLITANKNVNSDLFWACKGAGGGNFGIIVSMTYKLPAKLDKITFFELYYPNSEKSSQIEFLDVWQNWIQTATKKITMTGGLYNSSSEGFYIYSRGFFYGNPDDLKTILSPFSKIKGYTLNYNYTSFLQGVNSVASSYPQYEYFKSGGRFVQNNYSYNQLNELVNIVNESRPNGSLLTAVNFYGLGGKVKEISKYDTAFYYRDSNYILLVQSVFENNLYKAENFSWVNEKYNYLYSITDGSYVNFPFSPLADYLYDYFGNNVQKLKYVKQKYDPFNVFNFQQGIK